MTTMSDRAKVFGAALRAELRNAESIVAAMDGTPGMVTHRKEFWQQQAASLTRAVAAFETVELELMHS